MLYNSYNRYNTIYTLEEYMAQGFTAEEAPLMREHDQRFNLDVDNNLTEEQRERMFYLIDLLML